MFENYQYYPAAFEYQQQEEPAPSGKSKKIILTLLLLLPFLFLLTTLILFIFFLVNQTQEHNLTEITSAVTVTTQLKDDLSHPLIKSIVATTNQCPGGTTELSLGEFPGIEKGCVCKDGAEWVEADESECNSNSNCKKGKGISASKYQTLFNGKKLCYTELPSNEYIYGTKQDCNQQATLNKYCKSGVCMQDLDDCPINTAYFFDELVEPGVDLKAEEVFLNFQNQLELTPLIGFQLGYSSYCLNNIVFPALKSQSDYPLIGKQYAGCDQYLNYESQGDAFKIADTKQVFTELNYEKTLTLNSIPYTDNSESPYYKDYIQKYANQDKWKFYQINRPKVGANAICSQNKGFDNLKHISGMSTSIIRPLLIFAIIGLALSVLGFLVWIGLLLTSFILKKSKKNAKRASRFLKVTHILAILVALFLIFIFIYYSSAISDDKAGVEAGEKGFQKAISYKCYEQTKGFNGAINVLQQFSHFILQTAYSYILAFFIIAIVYIVLFGIFALVCNKLGESPFLAPYVK